MTEEELVALLDELHEHQQRLGMATIHTGIDEKYLAILDKYNKHLKKVNAAMLELDQDEVISDHYRAWIYRSEQGYRFTHINLKERIK